MKRGALRTMVLFGLAVSSTPAGAQLLVVGVLDQAHREAPPLDESTALLAASETGSSQMNHAQAVYRFEQNHSTPATQLSRAELEEVRQRANEATRHLSYGEYDEAEADLRALGELRERALVAINREREFAQNALDGCLVAVRYHLTNDREAEAERQAMACRRAHPRVNPSPRAHPDAVYVQFQAAQRRIDALPPAQFNVTAEHEGCAVRINGVESGVTPLFLDGLRAGDVAVQVECDHRAGRVHRISVEPGPQTLHVDTRLERAVRTQDDHLSLDYAEGELNPAHLAMLETATNATGVIAVRHDGQHVWVDYVRDGEGIGRVHAPRPQLSRALQSALAGRALDLTGDDPVELDGDRREPSSPRSGADRRVAWALSSVIALASAGVSWGGYRLQRKDVVIESTGVGFTTVGFFPLTGIGLGVGLVGVAGAAIWSALAVQDDVTRRLLYPVGAALLGAGAGLIGAAADWRDIRLRQEADKCRRGLECAPVRGYPGAYFGVGLTLGIAGVGLIGTALALDLFRPSEEQPSSQRAVGSLAVLPNGHAGGAGLQLLGSF